MNTIRSLVLTALALAPCAFAVETRTWLHNKQGDFEKGTLKNLSLRSDGSLSLAPAFKELFDSSTAYLWALAEDSKGTLYAGGGSPGATSAKLFALDAQRKSRVLAELPGLEIHALAIDKQDRVYAATAPDGKVYRVTGDGKHSVFYDPRAKYIWAMAFSSKGDLYVATGDGGEIHRVTPDGQGAVFFNTEETHARSMIVDANDNLVVGTEPGGLIVRISPAGAGFVLHQSGKKEITALAAARDGSLYVAAAGVKTAGTFVPSVAPAPAPATAPGARPGIQPVPSAPPPATLQPPTGGSEVYRIGKDGYPQRVWNHAQDVVYSIGFDAAGLPLLATGNKGSIYRLDSDLVSTLLINAEPTQVTSIINARGAIYAATANVGKVYKLGPELDKSGSYESEALDGGFYSNWGRAYVKSEGSGVVISTRSGNLDRPQKNWSAWAALDSQGRVASPAARFLQYRISMNGGAASVREISLAYMAKNVAPVIQEVEITAPNYKHTPSLSLTPSARSITLPALGQRRPTPAPTVEAASTSASLQFTKGFIGVRWAANDANADSLVSKLEIRGVQESDWKLLQKDVREKIFSWDTAAFADGEYVIRLTTNDGVSNPPDQALSASLESERFVIDNTPPVISGLSGTRSSVKWTAADKRSVIEKAEYSINGAEWVVVQPTTKLSDSLEHSYSVALDKPTPEMTVAVRVTDEFENVAIEKIVIR